MKKLYEKTIRGYYVMSVVLGLLLAVAFGTMLEVAVLDAVAESDSERVVTFWDNVWGYLPTNLCDYFWRPEIRLRYLNILMVTTSVMSVAIFVHMYGTKNARSKITQAVATMLLSVFLMLTYGYATRGWIPNAALAMLPALMTVIPLLMLKRSRQPVDDIDLRGWACILQARVDDLVRFMRGGVDVNTRIAWFAIGALACLGALTVAISLFSK